MTDTKDKAEDIIECPLCFTSIHSKMVANPETRDKTILHLWSCPACPFLGFEHVTFEDYNLLGDYLAGDKNIIIK